MHDAAPWRPECEAVVESTNRLILELHGPGRAAIKGFVDAKVRGVIPDGH